MLRVGRTGALALLCSGIAFVEAPYAAADEPATAIRMTYRAPGDCPESGEFSSQLLRRTARVRLARPEETGVVRLMVTLSANQRGYSGRLEITRSDGRALNREVDGDTCEELVSALALVTALVFDPNASVGPLPAAPAPRPESAPEAPAMTQAAPQPLAQPTPPQSAPEARPRPQPATRERSAWQLAVGGQIAARGEVTPDLIVVLPVFLELELRLQPPFSLVLRTAFERSQYDVIETERGQASFRWTVGSLEACPIEWSSSDFRALPCLRLEAGVLEAEGSRIARSRSDRRPWVGTGAVGRAEWSFLEPAFAEIGAGVVFPLIRDRFFFQPDETVHRPAPVGWLARVGLGLRFP